jgi:hypothetical protein
VLAVHPRVTECCTAATPVPETEMLAGEAVALLVIVTVPLAAVVPVGANVTVSVTFCPGVSVSGGVTPLMPKPKPVVTLAPEIVKFALPLLVSVTVCVPVVPSVTFPKLTLFELTPRTRVAATPVPVNGSAVGEVDTLLTIETLPLTAVVPVGAKFTLKVEEAPAARFSGSVNPETL